MIRVTFVNDTGKIEYNHELRSMQVSFDGTGDYHQHVRTLNIAADMAKLYHIFSFLLCQHRFASLTPHAFRQLLCKWLCHLPEAFGEHPVCVYLVVPPEALTEIAEIQEELRHACSSSVIFHVFSSMQEFEDFHHKGMASVFSALPFFSN